jgi:hypothetical protein
MGCSHHLGTQRLHEISVVYADLFCVVAPIAHVLVGLSAIHLEIGVVFTAGCLAGVMLLHVLLAVLVLILAISI